MADNKDLLKTLNSSRRQVNTENADGPVTAPLAEVAADFVDKYTSANKTENEADNGKATAESALIDFRQLFEEEMHQGGNNILSFVGSLIKKGRVTASDIKKEVDSIDTRMAANQYNMLSAMMLMQAGQQGAVQLLARTEEEQSKLSYFRAEVVKNPERYAALKTAELTGQLSAFMQASAGIVASLQKKKAEAAQAAAQYNNSLIQGLSTGDSSKTSSYSSNYTETIKSLTEALETLASLNKNNAYDSEIEGVKAALKASINTMTGKTVEEPRL